MNKILITGAGGFVGSHLIKALHNKGNAEIFAAVYQSTSDVAALVPADHIIEGDLTNTDFAATLVQQTKPDVIYHLAALSVVGNSVIHAVRVMNGNTSLSYNLLEAIKNHAPHARFIAICSANEYGAVQDPSLPITESTPLRPLNPYAISKVTQEMLALQYHLAYGLDIVILRPFNHTGVGQTTEFVIPKLASQVAQIEQNGTPAVIEVGNLGTVRDFTDVRDMVQAYSLAAQSCLAGEIYNIGSGRGHSIQEIFDIFQSLTKVKLTAKVNPDLVRPADVPTLVADATKFRETTGWSPEISLKTTISDILESYRKQKG